MTSQQPLSVVYGTATAVNGTPPVTVACAPASGSEFALGTTVVTCTATDAQQRIASCSLSVTVTPPPQIALTRFAAFGDSITFGEDGTYAVTSSLRGTMTLHKDVQLVGFEYPTVLQSELRKRFTLQTDIISVANLGKPAEEAEDPLALSRFSTDVLGGGYQAVLIMEGTNDVSEEYYGNVAAEQLALNNLRTMIERARNAGVRPYLATIPPEERDQCNPACRGFAADLVPAFNDRIRTLAATQGVTLVDVYQAFGGDLSLLSGDGLHPNAAGYQRMADVFFDALKATLEFSPGPVVVGAPVPTTPSALAPARLSTFRRR